MLNTNSITLQNSGDIVLWSDDKHKHQEDLYSSNRNSLLKRLMNQSLSDLDLERLISVLGDADKELLDNIKKIVIWLEMYPQSQDPESHKLILLGLREILKDSSEHGTVVMILTRMLESNAQKDIIQALQQYELFWNGASDMEIKRQKQLLNKASLGILPILEPLKAAMCKKNSLLWEAITNMVDAKNIQELNTAQKSVVVQFGSELKVNNSVMHKVSGVDPESLEEFLQIYGYGTGTSLGMYMMLMLLLGRLVDANNKMSFLDMERDVKTANIIKTLQLFYQDLQENIKKIQDGEKPCPNLPDYPENGLSKYISACWDQFQTYFKDLDLNVTKSDCGKSPPDGFDAKFRRCIFALQQRLDVSGTKDKIKVFATDTTYKEKDFFVITGINSVGKWEPEDENKKGGREKFIEWFGQAGKIFDTLSTSYSTINDKNKSKYQSAGQQAVTIHMFMEYFANQSYGAMLQGRMV